MMQSRQTETVFLAEQLGVYSLILLRHCVFHFSGWLELQIQDVCFTISPDKVSAWEQNQYD